MNHKGNNFHKNNKKLSAKLPKQVLRDKLIALKIYLERRKLIGV